LASGKLDRTTPSPPGTPAKPVRISEPQASDFVNLPRFGREMLIPAALILSFLLLLVFINRVFYRYQARSLVKKGMRMRAENKTSEALNSFKHALYFDPSSSTALSCLGEIFLQKGDVARGKLYLEKATDCRRIDGKGLFYLGSLYCISGEAGKLEKLISEGSIKIERKDEPFIELLKLTAAAMFPSRHEFIVPQENAMKARLLSLQGIGFFKVHCGLIDLYQKKPDEALEIFSRLTAEKSDNISYETYLAMALLQKGKNAEALSKLQHVTQQDRRDGLALQYLAKFYIDENLIDEAERYLAAAAELNRNSAGVYFFLGEVALKKKDYPSARLYYGRSLSLQPNNGEALKKLSSVLDIMKLDKQADELKNKALVNEGPLYILAPAY
jgi:tetratricopeptide (TPR) repeat protein